MPTFGSHLSHNEPKEVLLKMNAPREYPCFPYPPQRVEASTALTVADLDNTKPEHQEAVVRLLNACARQKAWTRISIKEIVAELRQEAANIMDTHQKATNTWLVRMKAHQRAYSWWCVLHVLSLSLFGRIWAMPVAPQKPVLTQREYEVTIMSDRSLVTLAFFHLQSHNLVDLDHRDGCLFIQPLPKLIVQVFGHKTLT